MYMDLRVLLCLQTARSISLRSDSRAKLASRTTRCLSWRFALRSSRLLLTERQLANLIDQRAALSDATRNTAVARRDIKTRVPCEEVPGSKQQTHWLGWHDGKVLRGREVSKSESVPEYDVGVLEIRCWVRGDPGWYALRRLARGLRDVAPGGVDLRVVVCGR